MAVELDCAPGTVSTGGNTTCTVCPAGKYCPNTDGTGIGSCLPGQYSLPGERIGVFISLCLPMICYK